MRGRGQGWRSGSGGRSGPESWGSSGELVGERWGPAEQAAMERCLALQTDVGPFVGPTPSPTLSRVIEAEIIPRLLLAHRGFPEFGVRPAAPDGEPVPQTQDVEALVAATLKIGLEAALAEVSALRLRGVSIERIFLDLLAPSAQLLGDMWEEDLCSFAEVTLGLSRLQQVLRVLGQPFREEQTADAGGRILLTMVPGEQHSFGMAMLEEFFTRAGWGVQATPASSLNEIVRAVRSERFDVVGLSLSSDVLLDGVRPLIQAVRRASLNRRLVVMVGGRYFIDHPDDAADVGADVAAVDAPDALAKANSSLGVGPSRLTS